MKLTNKQLEQIEDYLLIIKIIEEKNNDEYSEFVNLMADEALRVLAIRFKEELENEVTSEIK